LVLYSIRLFRHLRVQYAPSREKKKNSTTRHALRVRLVLCHFQCILKALMGHYPLFSRMKAIHFSRADPKPLVLGEPYSLTRAKWQLKVRYSVSFNRYSLHDFQGLCCESWCERLETKQKQKSRSLACLRLPSLQKMCSLRPSGPHISCLP
jgi:hypothetical protein